MKFLKVFQMSSICRPGKYINNDNVLSRIIKEKMLTRENKQQFSACR